MKVKKSNYYTFGNFVFLFLILSLGWASSYPFEVMAADNKPNFDKRTTSGAFCDRLWDEVKADKAQGKNTYEKEELYEAGCSNWGPERPRVDSSSSNNPTVNTQLNTQLLGGSELQFVEPADNPTPNTMNTQTLNTQLTGPQVDQFGSDTSRLSSGIDEEKIGCLVTQPPTECIPCNLSSSNPQCVPESEWPPVVTSETAATAKQLTDQPQVIQRLPPYSPTGGCTNIPSSNCIPCDLGLPGANCIPADKWRPGSLSKTGSDQPPPQGIGQTQSSGCHGTDCEVFEQPPRTGPQGIGQTQYCIGDSCDEVRNCVYSVNKSEAEAVSETVFIYEDCGPEGESYYCSIYLDHIYCDEMIECDEISAEIPRDVSEATSEDEIIYEDCGGVRDNTDGSQGEPADDSSDNKSSDGDNPDEVGSDGSQDPPAEENPGDEIQDPPAEENPGDEIQDPPADDPNDDDKNDDTDDGNNDPPVLT